MKTTLTLIRVRKLESLVYSSDKLFRQQFKKYFSFEKLSIKNQTILFLYTFLYHDEKYQTQINA